METVIPVLPCGALDELLAFYRSLGFAVTHEQTEPYVYAAVQRGNVELHFAHVKAQGKTHSFGSCLVMVDDVASVHAAFADGLRAHYGRVPTAGTPRMMRLRPGQMRFQVHDPAGNVLFFIDRREPAVDYSAGAADRSPLARSLDNAEFLRDVYANDEAAARVLDKALARHSAADPVERARALAAAALLAALAQIDLPQGARERWHDELTAAEALQAWIGQPSIQASITQEEGQGE